MDNCLINFTVIGDNRGSLISLEALKNIPFEIKEFITFTTPSMICQEGFMLIEN